jgi:hypothetical protein
MKKCRLIVEYVDLDHLTWNQTISGVVAVHAQLASVFSHDIETRMIMLVVILAQISEPASRGDVTRPVD